MSVGLRWHSAMRAEVTAGVAGKKSKMVKQGVSLDMADPAAVSTLAYLLRFVRYAEVLIDVRAHTETIVSSEQPYAK